jgi:hypothetical protein
MSPLPHESVIAILEAAGGSVKKTGATQWMANCPAHEDRVSSLSIGIGHDGRALVHCHSGCPEVDVWAALGIEARELFTDDDGFGNGQGSGNGRATPAPSARPVFSITQEYVNGCRAALMGNAGVLQRLRELRGWTATALERLSIGLDSKLLTIPIHDRDGKLVGLNRYQPNPERRNGQPKMIAAPGSQRDLFPAIETIGADKTVFVVEGEGDAISAASIELSAVAIPGAAKRDKTWAARFDGRHVVVCLDCDRPGREAAAWLAAELLPVAASVRVLDLAPDRSDGYDIGDLVHDEIAAGASWNEIRAWLTSAADALDPLPRDSAPLTPADGAASDADTWSPLIGYHRPAFPVDALPLAVKTWVLAEAEESQTPVDLAACAALGVLSTAGMGPRLECGALWVEESLGLYLLVALPASERKSAVLQAARAPLVAIQGERQRDAKPDIIEARARRDGLAEKIARLKKSAGNSDPVIAEEAQRELVEAMTEHEKIGEPELPRLFTDDCTPEALGGLLSKHGKMAVLAAESAFLDNLIGRYNEGGAPNLHLVCGAYTAESTTIDRRGRDSEQLDRPLLAITLVVQPHVLSTLVEHRTARSQGLVARFACCLPVSTVGRRNTYATGMPQHVRVGWELAVRKVAAAENAANAATNTSETNIGGIGGTFDGLEMRLAPEAFDLLQELRAQLEPRLLEGDGDLDGVSDWVGRHPGRIARIAALLHLLEGESSEPVSADAMRAALRIGEYFLAHAQAALVGPQKLPRRALAWITRNDTPTITLRDIYRGVFRAHGPVGDAENLVRDLERLGALRLVPHEERQRGRPPSPTYEVHPELIGGPR